MKMKFVILTCAGLVALAATAYDWPTKENCVQLQASDTKTTSSYVYGDHWPNATLPTSDQDCWVPSGLKIFVSGDAADGRFPGKSLTIDTGAELHGESCSKSIKTTYLRLLAGSKLMFSNQPCPKFTYTTVESTDENPAIIYAQRSDASSWSGYFPVDNFISDENSKVILQWTGAHPCTQPTYTSATFAQYRGTFRFDRSESSLKDTVLNATNKVSAALSFAKRLEIGKGITFYRSGKNGSITAGEAKLEAGSVLCSAYRNQTTAFLTVTNKLELEDGAVYDTSGYPAADIEDFYQTYMPIRLKDDAVKAENLPDFSKLDVRGVTDLGYNYVGLDARQGLFDDPSAEGEMYYGFRSGRPTRALLLSTSAKYLYTNETYWTDGKFPSGEENALVAGELNLNITTNFPGVVTLPFGGLILNDGILTMATRNLTVTNLFALGGSLLDAEMQYWNSSSKQTAHNLRAGYLRGDYLGVYGASGASCRVAHGHMFLIDMPMYGDGPMRATVATGTSYPRGGIEFTQINTNFYGKFTVASDGNKDAVDSSAGKRLQFYATDARNVGGDMPEETFDGLTLRGDSLFIGSNSLCFNQKHRGVYVQDRIRFVMQHATDNTLTISNNVTYGGEMVFGNDYPNAGSAKVGKGGGTLVLGGRARFYDPDTETVFDDEVPANCTNKLTMLIGRLRPVTTNALDGVAVTFGAESDGLEIDADASADMKAKGFRSVLAGSALVSNRTDGKIPVSVRGLDRATVAASGNSVTLAIATVPNDRVEATQNLFTLNGIDHVRTRILPAVDNGDGTSTIFAECYRCGLTVIVR